MDLKDKEYFSVAGETESSAPKSMYSLAQIFLLSLGVTLLPRATAILANGFLLLATGADWMTYLEVYFRSEEKLLHQPLPLRQ